MKSRFGYACINLDVGSFSTCRLGTFQKLGSYVIKENVIKNLNLTLSILNWNIHHNIFFYRTSSDLIPLATHSSNNWQWFNDPEVLLLCGQIKDFVLKHSIRLSVHPGQYSPLNSNREEVFLNTLKDFNYHDKLLELLGGSDMITHTGGSYGNKEHASQMFIDRARKLPSSIRQKLRIENDDKIFNLSDVIAISEACKIPVCYDWHHNNCLPSNGETSELLKRAFATWDGFGRPKVHISSGHGGRRDRKHAGDISQNDLEELLEQCYGYDVDIMFESKNKNRSLIPFLQWQNL